MTLATSANAPRRHHHPDPHPDPLDALLQRLDGVRPAGGGYVARCPVPDHGRGRGDRSPSLNVGTGDDGRVLVKCMAGCPTAAVLDAVGLTMAALFPPRRDAPPARRMPYGRFVDAAKALRRPPDPRPDIPAPAGHDFRADARRWFLDAGPHRARLADRLGVAAWALELLGIGHAEVPGRGRCWTWPTWRPEAGRPTCCGVKLRRDVPPGRRHHDALPGSAGGVTPPTWAVKRLDAGRIGGDDRPSLIVLTEGVSDAAAALTALDGHDRVLVAALPSCGQGLGHVRLLLNAIDGRGGPVPVLVLGDRDEPGRAGAERAASAVAACGHPAATGYPPPGHGDVRAWVSAGADAADILALADRGRA